MNKSLIIPLALLAVLLVVYLLVSQSEQREMEPDITDNFLGIDSGAVDRIELKKLGSTLEFTRRGDGWYMGTNGQEYKAEPRALSQIESMSYSMKTGEIVSSNPDKQMLFQVDSLMGTRVNFYRDTDLLGSVIVGKTGSSFQYTYVRKPESDNVYNAEGSYSRIFSQPPSSFRDKTLLSLQSDQINVIQFEGMETDYSLMNQDSVWKVLPQTNESFVGDMAAVDALIRQFANLRFNDFVKNPDSLAISFSQPDLRIIIGVRDGTERRLLFVKQEEGKNYYVKTEASDEPFVIYEYALNGLVRKPVDLRPREES
jgi:hypothetical protein